MKVTEETIWDWEGDREKKTKTFISLGALWAAAERMPMKQRQLNIKKN